MSANVLLPRVGISLPNGSSIVHGEGVNRKTVFSDLGFPVTMNEFWPGTERGTESALSFGGQLGLIDFDTSIRLPRHVHIVTEKDANGHEVQRFIHERILVLDGIALVEMNGEIYVIPPRTLVTIAPGVPHTWTACPPGICVESVFSDTISPHQAKTVSTGEFLMVYEYEDPTSFRPTRQTDTLRSIDEYVVCETKYLDEIRIPMMSAAEVQKTAWFVFNKELRKAS